VLDRLADIRVEIRTSMSRDDLLTGVAAGRIKAGHRRRPRLPAQPEPLLTFLHVDTVPFVLVAAPDHRPS
jgi:hypothetical protein